MNKVDKSKDQVFESSHQDAVAVHEGQTKQAKEMVVADERLEHGGLLIPVQEAEFHDSMGEKRQMAQSDD